MSINSFLMQYAGVMGEYVSGDVGDLTFYTTRKGNVIAYPKSPPCKPPTEPQLRCRSRFRLAQRNWMNLPTTTRAQWELAMQICGIDMTGQNAWISLSLTPTSQDLDSINARAGTSLTMPPYIPW